jgi:DEAD/DEAH box helicase domain-containing protein
MTLTSLLSRWRSDPAIGANIVEWRTIPARTAHQVPIPDDLHPVLGLCLINQGIHTLYYHQLEAWKKVQQGSNIVVQTGAASGKTYCYNLPVIDQLIRDTESTALYLFPTKALAQDQLSKIHDLIRGLAHSQNLQISQAAIYDGDTPTGARSSIRSRVRLLISNPDMLHTGILPHHANWARYWRGLRFIVIDEMHSYRGVFGSHVANVFRRLKRVAHFYGSYPQFILTSATIGNPTELAKNLIEQSVELVNQDGAAKGAKHFLVYNPPLVDPDLGIRRSSLQESVRLVEDLEYHNIQTVVFCRSRRSVEILLTYLKESLSAKHDTSLRDTNRKTTVRGYRSGYLPDLRRDIELGLRSGDVRVVVATSALELGVDIGGMGASVLVGYPGTISATWQQVGRAGRGDETALAVLVASASPLDQFLARYPGYFFGRSPEQGLINPDNLLILLNHLRCAAFELPFRVEEGFGNLNAGQLKELLDFLVTEKVLHQSGERYFWMADQFPTQSISLRSASSETVVLQAELETTAGRNSITVGKVDKTSATRLVHPGAIYLHEAKQYYVSQLDLEKQIAILLPVNVDYYTEPRTETTVQLIECVNQTIVPGGLKTYGDIQVHTEVVGFRKIRWHTHETLGLEPLQLPPSELVTTGYWVAVAEGAVEQLQNNGFWLNEPNEYGASWDRLRDRVKARDGYRCQACGLLENIRAHDVHHKMPLRLFASIEQANQLSNLVTLCSTCHQKAEMAVRVRSGLAGLGFTLANLAPLYLMCDPGDLGLHSDPESPLANGRPSIVLYDLVPAGIGFSQRLFEIHTELINQASKLVKGCACNDGCPSCVGPGGEGGSGGKQETLALLDLLN